MADQAEFEELNYIIEAPELDSVVLHPSHKIELKNLDTDRPIMKVGSVLLVGQFQHVLGTAVVLEPTTGDGEKDSSGIVTGARVEALTSRKIVFTVVSGDVASLAAEAGPAAAAASS